MAKIYLAHSLRDADLAKEIELRLQSKGHRFTYAVSTQPFGNWRKKLADALRSADVIIPLLTQNGLQSSFVVSEIGAARVYDELRGMLITPIIFGENVNIPSFIDDYHCFFLRSSGAGDIDVIVNQIHTVISQYSDEMLKNPRIFISHRHKDVKIAEALLNLLESAFHIEKIDIRCTSVQPYTLPSGEKTSEKLRTEISSAEVVIGLLTPDTRESNYVIAELGAAWGCNIPTFPLLARGATYEHVPEPLNERHSLSLQKESDCLQLIDDIARESSLTRRTEVSGRVTRDAKNLSEIANEL
ncbi:MAG TPA: toll/interleukin-1 receptor domain-containing protein [Anaerolineales bacterium]|nr:toll/interleukin-1 receptor domain-containing protein [Anaerolineales bacterium]HLO31294.1 toll/interleukin-1 receptor domain-containing protein [Anaerolineales bacterium]